MPPLSVVLAASLFVAGAPPEGWLEREFDLGPIVEPTRHVPASTWPQEYEPVFASERRPAGPHKRSPAGAVEQPWFPLGDEITANGIADFLLNQMQESPVDGPGAYLAAQGERLRVVQPPAVIVRIAALLDALAAMRSQRFVIDVAFLPLEALPDPVPGPDAGLPGLALEEALARAGTRGSLVALAAGNGQVVSAFAGTRQRIVKKLEINQTGVVPVSNPVDVPLHLGTTVEVEPLASGPGGPVRLILAVTRASLAGEPERRETFFGDIDLPTTRQETLRTTLAVRPGETVLAGLVEQSGEGNERFGFAVLVRVRRAGPSGEKNTAPAPMAEASPGGKGVRVWDLAIVLESIAGEKPLLEAGLIPDLLREVLEPDALDAPRGGVAVLAGRYLCVWAPPAVLAETDRWMRGRVDRRSRIAEVTLEEIEGPGAELLAAPGALQGGNGGKDLRRRGRLILRAVLGGRASAGAFEDRALLPDAEWVSGGTGFSIVTIPDPVVLAVRSGLEAAVTVRDAGLPSLALVDLDAARYRSTVEGKVRFLGGVTADLHRRPEIRATATGGAAAVNPDRSIGLPFDLDEPRQESFEARGTFALTAGRPESVAIRVGPGGAARVISASLSRSDAPADRK